MTRSGITTIYRGIRFRSRLEARWAKVFDALDWAWEYEPLDLNGYIPDFVLKVPAGPVLVEVKPCFNVADLVAEAAGKIERSGWRTTNFNAAIIVGATWNLSEGRWDHRFEPGVVANAYPVLGAVARRQMPDEQAAWAEGVGHSCMECDRNSIYTVKDGRSYVCTVCNAKDPGDYHVAPLESRRIDSISRFWGKAGNDVQWNPPR